MLNNGHRTSCPGGLRIDGEDADAGPFFADEGVEGGVGVDVVGAEVFEKRALAVAEHGHAVDGGPAYSSEQVREHFVQKRKAWLANHPS